MKLGCNTVLLSMVDLEGALQHLEWAGYKYVELAAIKGMCEHIKPGDSVTEIKDRLAAHNLTPTAMEAATLERERLTQLFDLAHAVGIGIVNIGSGGKTGDEETVVQAIALIREYAQIAADHGVRLAVKPHVGQAIYNAATGMRLIEEVQHPALGLNFDPSHLFRANETPELVAKLWGPHTITSHFRDCPWREGSPGTPDLQIPGRGQVDIPATLAALKAAGYAGPLNLEVIGAFQWPLSRAMGVAAETHGYMNRCLQELGY